MDEEEAPRLVCLLCASELAELSAVLSHMNAEHGFDFQALRKKLGVAGDAYATIRLINFIRGQVKAGASKDSILSQLQSREALADEKLLLPVLEEDELLQAFIEEDEDDESAGAALEEQKGLGLGGGVGASVARSAEEYEAEIAALRAQVAGLQEQIRMMREAFARVTEMEVAAPDSVASPKPDEEEDDNEASEASEEEEDSAPPLVDVSSAPAPHQPQQPEAKREPATEEERKKKAAETDQYYFDSYSSRRIHELMLKDSVRTLAYRDFMYENKHLFEGKSVLDVGCGTGILCMFAAKAGAKRVIGIDRAGIIDKAKEIVRANKLDHIITLIKSKVEEASLPVDKVDIIISEWMGYFLLFESMLPSVLYARDRYLAPGGAVYPDKAIMYIAGAEASQRKADTEGFWRNVYGFDMSCLIEDSDRYGGSRTEIVKPDQLMTSTAEFKRIDIATVRPEELDFTSKFSVTATRDDSLDAFVVWFDTPFEKNCTNPINLSTSPLGKPTHWMQTVFYLYNSIKVKAGDVIEGEITAWRPAKCERDYNVRLRYWHVPAAETERPAEPKVFIQEFEITGWDPTEKDD